MKYYLAGPMSGYPQFNFPAFDAAATDLRRRGYEIISPAEMDTGPVRDFAMESKDGCPTGLKGGTGATWGDLLSRDVKIVADEVQGIVFLPGWEKSRGARLEAFTGVLCRHKFVQYDNGTLTSLSAPVVLAKVGFVTLAAEAA